MLMHLQKTKDDLELISLLINGFFDIKLAKDYDNFH